MSSQHRPLPAQHEAVLRLVHALGRASVSDLLSACRAQPLSAKAMRHLLDRLADAGWLLQVRDHRRRQANGVAWCMAELALPHLLADARLPLRPGDESLQTGAARPLPPPQRRYAGAMVPPRDRDHLHTTYVPPRAAPMRPGALDHMRCRSRGAFQ